MMLSPRATSRQAISFLLRRDRLGFPFPFCCYCLEPFGSQIGKEAPGSFYGAGADVIRLGVFFSLAP